MYTRLELQAALIGARLAHFIATHHRLRITKRIFWTDSRNVICWLRSDHRRYTPFVGARIGEILETTSVDEWRWISTKINVADDGTKWKKDIDVSSSSRWSRGPDFIWEPEETWPTAECDVEETSAELRKIVPVLHHAVAVSLVALDRFSRWKRLVRAVGYVIRFTNNTRCRRRGAAVTDGPLTHEELAKAQNLVLVQIQSEAFPLEVQRLKNGHHKKQAWKCALDKGSPLYKLSPEIDEFGVLRMSGRFGSCLLIDESMRKPVILPRKHYGTDLIIGDFHERYCHSNHRTVVNEIRKGFHIPKLMVEYNRVRRQCQLCKVRDAEPKPPMMGDVPQQRLAVSQRPFTYCGVDYFGPMNVAVGRRCEKRWGVVFTCLTTRAIHLEVAHTLTTDSCIMAIRRFIACRGRPTEFMSDRGTNFVGAARELMTVFNSPEMKWTFNPPAAPHFGGCWERLVQSVKRTMAKMNLPRTPNDEVLKTTLKEIELIINSRPLTYIPLDDEEAAPITPNHILLGSSNGDKPRVTLDDSPSAVRSSWEAAQRNADRFWEIWVRDYLPILTRRTKWFHPVRPIDVGDIVVVVDNTAPRNQWPKGRVIKVVRAQDGQVRRATVQTQAGVFERPASKIAVLDISPRESNQNN